MEKRYSTIRLCYLFAELLALYHTTPESKRTQYGLKQEPSKQGKYMAMVFARYLYRQTFS